MADVSIPESFVRRISTQLGDESGNFLQALEGESVVSQRYNPRKMMRPDGADVVAWCGQGAYLAHRPVFALDPLWHAGAYYVQEASSMFLEQVVVQLSLNETPVVALDLCASPGGKTTHLASLLHPESLIVSNEAIQSRLGPLRENVIKWGMGNSVITTNDPADFQALEEIFDLVVVDAPCSGEGLFRKDKASREQWSESSCDLCVSRQHRILESILPSLKPGGALIYSTCTWNRQENEDRVQWLQQSKEMDPVRLNVTAWPGIVEVSAGKGFGYSFFPHRIRGEGFFLAALRNPGTVQLRKPAKVNRSLAKLTKPGLEDWIAGDGYKLFMRGNHVIAIPDRHHELMDVLSARLNIRYAGLEVAEMKGEKAIPAHALAMSPLMNRSLFPVVELDEKSALAFLRKDAVAVSSSKGWTLVTYKDIPLGWLNNLGNRTNNYYPIEWRLRMK